MPRFTIEPARPDDLAALPAIEREAAALFADSQIPAAALRHATPLADLDAARRAGRLWIARIRDEGVVGFALAVLLDGAPHLEEMDVRPAHGRRGIGRALVRAVQAWVGASGHTSLTLTTFRDVPWNAPFYARLGFSEVPAQDLSPALREVVRGEAIRGLDPAQRIVMCWSRAWRRPPALV